MEKDQTRKCVINNASKIFNAVQGSNIKVTMINSAELEKYAKDYLEKLFGNATLIQGISAYHFLEPTDNGYVMKRYSSFIINESTATEVEEKVRKLKSKKRSVVGTLSTWKNTSIGISVWFWKYVMKD